MLKAVIYDFDGTLTPNIKPEFKILEKIGQKGNTSDPQFVSAMHQIIQKRHLDPSEALMLAILDAIRQGGFPLTDETIALGADERVYHPGVEDLLKYLQEHHVQNYILSSGSQAYLQHIKIAPYFTEIYASVLSYDTNGEATGIERVMSPAEKSVALQEIAERVNGASNDCSGIIYIGDGPTDADAMRHITQHRGKAILVQSPSVDPAQLQNIPADLTTPPDFTINGELANYLKQLLVPAP